MKKRNKIICIIACIVIISLGLLYLTYPKYDINKIYVKEYIVGEKGIKGNVNITMFDNNTAYEIGANSEGYAVFKDPDRAFRQMKIDYSEGIEAIQKEYFLLPLSRWNYKEYRTYGWQLSDTKNSEAVEQARKLTPFLDIYGNSFK